MQSRDSDNLLDKVKKESADYLVSSTAGLSESTPIFALFETQVAGMTPEVSMNTRLYVTGLTYLGLGYVFAKGRDIWRNTLGITDKSNRKVQAISDSVYGGLFTLAVTPGLYFMGGSRDINEITAGTVVSTLIGSLNGPLAGYAIDLGRDLTGIQESARVPKIIKKRNNTFKRTLAAGLVATSLALTAGIYEASENKIKDENKSKQIHIEQAILNSKED